MTYLQLRRARLIDWLDCSLHFSSKTKRCSRNTYFEHTFRSKKHTNTYARTLCLSLDHHAQSLSTKRPSARIGWVRQASHERILMIVLSLSPSSFSHSTKTRTMNGHPEQWKPTGNRSTTMFRRASVSTCSLFVLSLSFSLVVTSSVSRLPEVLFFSSPRVRRRCSQQLSYFACVLISID